MKKVSLKQIEGYNKSFDKNMKRKLMQNVLASTPIDQSVRVQSRCVDTQPIFSIDIQTMGAANQKSSGRCWIFAGTNVLREILGKKINVNDIELSQNFVSFYDRFEKINYLLEAIIELKDAKHDDRTLAHLLQNGVGDGGQWDMCVSIIKKYGVVPKSVYGETYQSSNTRGMNYVINNSIKKFAAFVSKNKDNLDLVKKQKEELLNKLYEFMCTCLGKPTEIENLKDVLVIGGGVGCAIALPVARALKDQGSNVTSIIGFRNKDLLILEDEFREASKELIVMTDDGTYGEQGNVTIPLKRLLESGKKFDKVITIGPLIMMKFVVLTCKEFGVPCDVSMNPIMIDGTGMCGGCRLTLNVNGEKVTKFACVDGPDFNGYEVDFDEAMSRNRMYQGFERHKYEETCNLLKKEAK